MIGGIGMPELIIILVIIIIIFGAGKLPELGSGVGKGIKNFKKAIKESGIGGKDKDGVLEDKDKDSALEDKEPEKIGKYNK
ncbi:MAG: twin-arginine translocase TatA/TatE family subunit [Thermodesulfobacteriota bacterium]|nr:twin-arginine translocase TatA/TatE family subunit [Thermodesulfobacteriota bacterium]